MSHVHLWLFNQMGDGQALYMHRPRITSQTDNLDSHSWPAFTLDPDEYASEFCASQLSRYILPYPSSELLESLVLSYIKLT